MFHIDIIIIVIKIHQFSAFSNQFRNLEKTLFQFINRFSGIILSFK